MRNLLDIFKLTPEDSSIGQLMELLEEMVIHIEDLEREVMVLKQNGP